MEPPPDALSTKEEPDLGPVEMMYWSHFQELQSERQIGSMGGASAIPWSSIDRYAERHGFLEYGYNQFFAIMRFLDNQWLTMMHEKQEKEKNKKASKPKSQPRSRRR